MDVNSSFLFADGPEGYVYLPLCVSCKYVKANLLLFKVRRHSGSDNCIYVLPVVFDVNSYSLLLIIMIVVTKDSTIC